MKAKVTTITPKPVRLGAMVREYRKGLEAFSKIVLFSLDKTVATWDKKPKFSVRYSPFTGDEIDIQFMASGGMAQIWNWTDQGTKPHVIRPKPGNKRGLLFFNSNFKAKTRPRVIGSTRGFSGPPLAAAASVNHPGTKARQFTTEIWRRRSPAFRRIMKTALNNAAKASGHGDI